MSNYGSVLSDAKYLGKTEKCSLSSMFIII